MNSQIPNPPFPSEVVVGPLADMELPHPIRVDAWASP